MSGGREPLLSIENVSVRFGGVRALDGVTCQVNAGEICGLIGPNGAGKTTLFNCITRLYPVGSGTIWFAGKPIEAVPPREIVSRGIARTFQNLGIYPDMTVMENVALGAHHSHGGRFFQTVVRPLASDANEHAMTGWCRTILAARCRWMRARSSSCRKAKLTCSAVPPTCRRSSWRRY